MTGTQNDPPGLKMLEQYDSSDFFTGGGGGQLGRVQSAPFDWPEAQKNSQLSWVISQAPLT